MWMWMSVCVCVKCLMCKKSAESGNQNSEAESHCIMGNIIVAGHVRRDERQKRKSCKGGRARRAKAAKCQKCSNNRPRRRLPHLPPPRSHDQSVDSSLGSASPQTNRSSLRPSSILSFACSFIPDFSSFSSAFHFSP
ncbi:hypothetical protein ABZX51_004649 [Aspergillus tubingensis]